MEIFFNEKDISEIEKALENTAHEEQAIRNVLDKYPVGKYFHNMDQVDLLNAMF